LAIGGKLQVSGFRFQVSGFKFQSLKVSRFQSFQGFEVSRAQISRVSQCRVLPVSGRAFRRAVEDLSLKPL
jgi:hypothetical protein